MIAQAAEIQVLLEGVDLPASKDDLIRYAREQDSDGGRARMLERLPARRYRSLDEVGEMLAPVQPYSSEDARLPHEESDLPPGGDDYLNPRPESGNVRDDAPRDNPPQKVIEKQSRAQSQQKERQEKLVDG